MVAYVDTSISGYIRVGEVGIGMLSHVYLRFLS